MALALYADEDFPRPTVLILRAAGLDVLRAQEDGRGNQGIKDPDVLDRAIALGRAVLTYNYQHFITLHRRRPGHAGIIACTRDDDWPALAARILAALSPQSDLRGKLVRINRPNPSRTS